MIVRRWWMEGGGESRVRSTFVSGSVETGGNKDNSFRDDGVHVVYNIPTWDRSSIGKAMEKIFRQIIRRILLLLLLLIIVCAYLYNNNIIML